MLAPKLNDGSNNNKHFLGSATVKPKNAAGVEPATSAGPVTAQDGGSGEPQDNEPDEQGCLPNDPSCGPTPV